MNIVVVVAGGLSEMLQAAPLTAALSGITGEPQLVISSPTAAELSPGLAGAHEFVPVRGLAARPGPLGLSRLWWELRRRRLDTAVVCSENPGVRAAVFEAGIPRRIGRAGGLSDRLLSERVGVRDGNRSRSWLALAGQFDASPAPTARQFQPSAEAARSAEQLLLSKGVGDGRLLVAIAPGQGFADLAVAAWSAERFAHLANRLATRHGAGVVLVGDARDRRAADAMQLDLAADTLDLCGELDLVTTAAVIARCDLLIAADTPLLHLAAAVGTASVGLFGPTDGRARAPAGAEHRVVQALPNGAGPASVDLIRVDDVLAGIESAL
ncbi:MAG TPA: glycosyltransferase family 9 protein [Candidatus Dormibacteraeota bacterium]|nr:glycosyltransferase family 9 protein [Candidatus Dormibacteraeota bacterium]